MKAKFSAWNESLRFLIPSAVLGLALVVYGWPGVLVVPGIVCLVFAGYALFFFRDPERAIPADPSAVVSAADGVVVAIEDLTETPYYDGPCKRISVFLSLFNVHVNRAPFACTVRGMEYKRGRFLDARLAETTELNEANTIYLDTDRGAVTVRQIAGKVARRIVCKCEVGDKPAAGERLGMIRFGSRTELYLPPGADVVVRVGQKVLGGATVVARFP